MAAGGRLLQEHAPWAAAIAHLRVAMPTVLVRNYVGAAIAQLRRLDLMRLPGKLPAQMRDPSIPPSDDWAGWKPIPSTVSDTDLDALERETGLAFPPLYRDFLQYQHFVALTEEGVRFLSLDPGGAGGPATEYWTCWGVAETG
jgi:hypothetical protein